MVITDLPFRVVEDFILFIIVSFVDMCCKWKHRLDGFEEKSVRFLGLMMLYYILCHDVIKFSNSI